MSVPSFQNWENEKAHESFIQRKLNILQPKKKEEKFSMPQPSSPLKSQQRNSYLCLFLILFYYKNGGSRRYSIQTLVNRECSERQLGVFTFFYKIHQKILCRSTGLILVFQPPFSKRKDNKMLLILFWLILIEKREPVLAKQIEIASANRAITWVEACEIQFGKSTKKEKIARLNSSLWGLKERRNNNNK